MTKIERLRALTELDLLEKADQYYSTKEFLKEEGYPYAHARYAAIVNSKMNEYDIKWASRKVYKNIECQACGKIFNTQTNISRVRKSCSEDCAKELVARVNRKSVSFCANCNKPLSDRRNTYCNSKCHWEYKQSLYIDRWQQGLEKGYYEGKTLGLNKQVRRYLLSKYDNTCAICGWQDVHPVDGKPLVEINHIDGDARNCAEYNLEVLCPNCHAKTHNFRARNSKSSRNRV